MVAFPPFQVNLDLGLNFPGARNSEVKPSYGSRWFDFRYEASIAAQIVGISNTLNCMSKIHLDFTMFRDDSQEVSKAVDQTV